MSVIAYVEKEPGGGYTAHVEGFSIFTQGDTLDEVVRNVREAVHCHFGDRDFPPQIAFDIPVKPPKG